MTGGSVEVDKNGRINTFRIPIPLVPVYVTLALQLLGVVFMSGVIWTKLDYNSNEIHGMKDKLDQVIQNGINDRYRGSDAKRDFSKVFDRFKMLEDEERKDVQMLNNKLEQLEFRVRHFQAQFPKKNILP